MILKNGSVILLLPEFMVCSALGSTVPGNQTTRKLGEPMDSLRESSDKDGSGSGVGVGRTAIGSGPVRRRSLSSNTPQRWSSLLRYCMLSMVICWFIMVPLSNYLKGHYRIVRIDSHDNHAFAAAAATKGGAASDADASADEYGDDHDSGTPHDNRHVTPLSSTSGSSSRVINKRGRTRGVRSIPPTHVDDTITVVTQSLHDTVAITPKQVPVVHTGPILDEPSVIVPDTPRPPTPSPTSPPTPSIVIPHNTPTSPRTPVRRMNRGNNNGLHSSDGNGGWKPPTRPSTQINDAARLAERLREDTELERQLRLTRPFSIDRGDRPPVCYPVPGMDQCAPFFFIIGVFKGGTTSVYNYLARHPGMIHSIHTHSYSMVMLRHVMCVCVNNIEVLCKFDTSEDESGVRTGNGDTAGGDDPHVVRTKETNFFSVYNRTDKRQAMAIAARGNARPPADDHEPDEPGLQPQIGLRSGSPKTIPDYMRIFFPKLYPSGMYSLNRLFVIANQLVMMVM
jgi:hypothetical protein